MAPVSTSHAQIFAKANLNITKTPRNSSCVICKTTNLLVEIFRCTKFLKYFTNPATPIGFTQ